VNKEITDFAKVGWRKDQRLFGIKQADRLMHTYMIGKTGGGKSKLIDIMIIQDIRAGRGCCLLDPNGDLAEKVV